MATGRVRVEMDYKDLDIHLEVKFVPQPKKELLKGANSIIRSILQLEHKKFEDHINKRCRKKIVSINEVLLTEKWHGTIKTVVKSREALHDLYMLCKRPQDKKSKNELTELLSDFFTKDYLNEKCSFPQQTNITFNVEIPHKRFEKAKKFFKEEINRIKESETSSEMMGSIRRSNSTEAGGDVTTIDEGSVLPGSGKIIQLLQHRFIVAVPKASACSKISIKSTEITQLNCALKQYDDCPEMFCTDVVLPADADGCYEYEFITKGRFIGSKTQSQPFLLTSTCIHRDLHEPKTCVLSHLRHIICSTEESSVFETCVEIEDVCKNYNAIAMGAIPELLQYQNKLSIIGHLKLVIAICFIKKDSLESLNTILTPTQAKLFIAPLLKASLQQLPYSCAAYMPFSCFQLYMIANGNELSICRFLFDFYHFFDDNAMIDTVTLLTSKHYRIALEDDLDIIVDLCQKLSVSENSAISQIQNQVFTTVDLMMGIQIYKKLIKKNIFECEEDTMSSVHSVLRKRFQETFISAQTRSSLHSALVFAEMLTESNANDELNLNTDIEQSLLKILINLSDVTNNEQMQLKNCLLHKSLFVNERTQRQLLEELSSSKSVHVRCIFIELATETKFKTAYVNLPVKDFQRYIECEIAACGRTGKKEKVNGNIEAFINVLKMPCMKSEPTLLDKLVEEFGI